MNTGLQRVLFAMLLLVGFGLFVGCTSDNPPVPTTPEAEFTPLFDGQSFNGWKPVGGTAVFKIEDGEVVGICGNAKKATFLRTEKMYADFEFRCQFKWDSPGNSGIQYRSHQRPSTEPIDPGRVYGYQFELDPSERAWSGGLYEEGRRGWIVNLQGEDNALKRDAIKLDGWNDIVIECRGKRIRTWLNGISIVSEVDDDGSFPLTEGFFALQVHAGAKGVFRWRNIRIKEYPVGDD